MAYDGPTNDRPAPGPPRGGAAGPSRGHGHPDYQPPARPPRAPAPGPPRGYGHPDYRPPAGPPPGPSRGYGHPDYQPPLGPPPGPGRGYGPPNDQPPFGPRRGPAPRRSSRGPRWGLLVAIGLIGLLLSGGGGALAYFMPALTAAVSSTGQSAGGPVQGGLTGNAPAALPPSAPFTVLFMGSDNDSKFTADGLLTQSMILVRVDPVAKHATMLSIPRDLYVPISNGGSNKIDAAFIRGGAATAMATVSRDFQIRIDDYVWIGLKGLVKLIDLVGGVDVTAAGPVMDDFYPADVESTNPYAYERVAVLAGPQHLDGVHAMEFVRSRHSDLQGDVGRSKRQQAVLIALRAKAKYLNPSDIPDLATTFSGEFKTSIPLTRIRSLLPLATAMSDPAQVKQVFLDGAPYYSAVTLPAPVGDALKPNWSAILPLVHQDFPA